MTAWLKALDQAFNGISDKKAFQAQQEYIERIAHLLRSAVTRLLEAVEKVDLSSQTINNDAVIAQSVIGMIAIILVGFTFLPFGATPASIRACQLNTDQKLLKYLGVVVVILAALSSILYLEVLKLYGLIGSGI